ncbi:DM9 repeat-containing protein [Pseudobacteriovorax antillogorgiicola]|uniref:Uncharacterized protein n=1 Tax=Pseudobacteriovorax antillogorgiicola TaxID=1513793 RepID=A0A1Y6BGE4_9BACT|nr:DM9 repeat-containing protein [Pseudobacteriovorax antillogorgiicola]TCS56373.1 uncharacterized protein DUF3421 [Pseudobacteriovorax antillogorgiicola]SMF06551.1 Protein of unknown function [Pseudobacteriovorax antillogorgiicola]
MRTLQVFCLATLAMGLSLACERKGPSPIQESQDYTGNMVIQEDLGPDRQGEDAIAAPERLLPELPLTYSTSFLYCDDFESPSAQSGLSQYEFHCALLHQGTKLPISPYQEGIEVAWSLNNLAADLANRVTITSLKQHKSWHAGFKVLAPSLEDMETIRSDGVIGIRFFAETVELGSAKTRISSSRVLWQSLNGNLPPANAYIAGSQIMATSLLYICRAYVNGAVIPGKAVDTTGLDNQGGVCYSLLDGQILTASTQTGIPFDILGYQNITDAEQLSWQAQEAGAIPEGAVSTGYLVDGTPLYSCRALQAGPAPDNIQDPNSNDGEPTPGYIKAGDTGCTYEYFGERTAESYEVLVRNRSSNPTVSSFTER